MARRNAMRSIEGETNLAWRISHEREERGWSYDALARRMTDAGCPINASAIYKIEKGDPPRKIGVDELIAFARVFGKHVDDLLTPRDIYQKERSKELVQAIEAAHGGLVESLTSLVDAYMDYFDAAFDDEDVMESVNWQTFAKEAAEERGASIPLFAVESGGREVDVDQTPLREGIVALHRSVIEQAYTVFVATNPELKEKLT